MSQRSRRCMITAALATLLAAPARVDAQDNSKAAAVLKKPFCFRGRALPRCRAFAITEFGADFRLYAPKTQLAYWSSYDSSTITYEFHPTVFSVTGEAGAMYNTNSRNAIGATMLLRNGSGGAQFGIKARYRRWLTPKGLALDVGVGIVSGDGASSLSANPSAGITGDVAINLQDYVALRMRIDLNRTQVGTKPALYAGVRAGSFPALGAAALAGTGFGVLLAIFVAAGGVD